MHFCTGSSDKIYTLTFATMCRLHTYEKTKMDCFLIKLALTKAVQEQRSFRVNNFQGISTPFIKFVRASYSPIKAVYNKIISSKHTNEIVKAINQNIW